jgi:hypothetical protein
MADRWKWPLLALAALAVAANVGFTFDVFGAGSRPWFGWLDVNYVADGHPYEYVLDAPDPGGAAGKAGLRAGDAIDLRQQSLAARVGLLLAPLAGAPLPIVVHRGPQTLRVVVSPTTSLQTNALFKTSAWLVLVLNNLWLAGCAVLIALWRPERFEGRMLAIILLATAISGGFAVVPSPVLTAVLVPGAFVAIVVGVGAYIALASRLGRSTTLRRVLAMLAYANLAAALSLNALCAYGLVTLRFDPLPFAIVGAGYPIGPAVYLPSLLSVTVVLIVGLAIANTPREDRKRVAWLLIPLPLGATLSLVFGGIIAGLLHSSPFWALFAILAGLSQLGAALAVTYAVIKRRVLDFEFVLSRTLVVAIISLIVVAAFTLLEWALGTVLAGLSRTAGIVANAGLALVLGVSLRYIHRRVDGFVDATFFRKRHADERALLDFSKEAAYVTNADALLDQGIEVVRQHTDARNAALYVDGAGAYQAARSFGDGAPANVDENDGAILALKTWHTPLDPHQCATALVGALALPMVARGRLVGVLLIGERAGGEAYASDEVDALAQFAQGVGGALDSLSAKKAESSLGDSLARIEQKLDRLIDAR